MFGSTVKYIRWLISINPKHTNLFRWTCRPLLLYRIYIVKTNLLVTTSWYRLALGHRLASLTCQSVGFDLSFWCIQQPFLPKIQPRKWWIHLLMRSDCSINLPNTSQEEVYCSPYQKIESQLQDIALLTKALNSKTYLLNNGGQITCQPKTKASAKFMCKIDFTILFIEFCLVFNM